MNAPFHRLLSPDGADGRDGRGARPGIGHLPLAIAHAAGATRGGRFDQAAGLFLFYDDSGRLIAVPEHRLANLRLTGAGAAP